MPIKKIPSRDSGCHVEDRHVRSQIQNYIGFTHQEHDGSKYKAEKQSDLKP